MVVITIPTPFSTIRSTEEHCLQATLAAIADLSVRIYVGIAIYPADSGKYHHAVTVRRSHYGRVSLSSSDLAAHTTADIIERNRLVGALVSLRYSSA